MISGSDRFGTTDGQRMLEEIRSVDETTLRFNAWGFGARLEPAQSADFLWASLSRATLVDVVSEDVRSNFERVRTLFLHGLLEYEFFSAAYDLGHLALEGALRRRFFEYYDGRIPVLRDGVSDLLVVRSFDDYYDVTATKDGRRLRLDHEPHETPPRGYSELYEWARNRRLLFGQRNIGVFGSIVGLRNYVAHPSRYTVHMPPDVVRFLGDVAEIINRLWGQNTEGGRLFPGPVERRPRAAALSPDRKASVIFPSLLSLRTEHERRDWTYALFLTASSEELVEFDWGNPGHQRFAHVPGLKLTAYPAELLWGPGSLDALVAILDDFSDQTPTDTVPFMDREFYIRVEEGHKPELPRDAADVIGLDVNSHEAVWYLVRADFPMDAWVAIRDIDDTPSDAWSNTSIAERLIGDAQARESAGARTAS